MVIIVFLYLAMIFVLLNLIVQIGLYVKDINERARLRMSLNRQVKPPKQEGIKFAKVGKLRSS